MIVLTVQTNILTPLITVNNQPINVIQMKAS